MSAGHLLFYLAAFALALGVLIVVHEFGHYLVARACGVKVLRFSIGFGRPILSRRGKDGTEWALAAFPLGGYVKMLDEAEAPVPVDELPRAFNRQPVVKRILIVSAGPIANLLLAILLYWVLFVQGVQEVRPVLAAPPAGSVAAAAGIESGETVRAVDGRPVATWQDLRWEMLNRALRREPVRLEVINQQQDIAYRTVETRSADLTNLEGDVLQQLGLRLYRPKLKPIIDKVDAGSPAAAAGLRPDDEILAIDGKPIASSGDVTDLVQPAAGRTLTMSVRRGGGEMSIAVRPGEFNDGGRRVGRIGVRFKDDPKAHIDMMTMVRYGPVVALGKAMGQTWETTALSLELIGRMIVGQVSWRNLSGPVTIADYAGQSASLGLGPYLNFLALISISLGVLNLLPIPVLDGGHLLYYFIEIVKGSPLSEKAADAGRQIGLALLVLLMIFAFYNDINRLLPG